MNARGFTLLEVLVALAILGVAVVACIQGFAGGLRLLKLSGDHQHAMLIADEKVREVVAPEETREDGTADRFQWTRTVSKVETPELRDIARPIPWTVYQIDVRVRWDERREVRLTTLRTVPDVAPGQLAPGATPAPAGAAPALPGGLTRLPTTATPPVPPTPAPGRR